MFKKVILIDGSGFIFRAFHALPPLKRPDGTPVGAVYGFCNMLQKFIDAANQDPKSEALAVIFDAGRKTFRQEIYPEYKAHRPDVPEDLIPQFPLIRQACQAFNVATIELDGYEADDLIASYAEHARHQKCEVTIVSSDKDLMQLIGKGISMFDPIKNKLIQEKEVFEKFGVSPDKVIDVQALAGDSSDNVPGVPGIGIKTAAELINEFGSLDALLQQAESIKQPKRRQTLLDNADKARISRQLVDLCRTAPLPTPLEKLKLDSTDPLILSDFLRQQGFNSLVTRLTKATRPAQSIFVEQNYKTVRTKEQLASLIKEIKESSLMAFDCETTSLNAVSAELVGISISTQPTTGYYIPFMHQEATPQLTRKDVLDALSPLLMEASLLKVGHNLKYDMVVLKKYGISLSPITDTMLLSYVLDGAKNGHGMDELAQRHLNYQTISYTDVTGTGKNQKRFDEVAIELATRYAAEDADITLRLYHLFQKRLIEEKMVSVFETIERPLIAVIAEMESSGIKVDPFLLHRLGQEFSTEMAHLEHKIYELTNRPFNIASPKQLGEILFDELNLPAPKKTKTGSYSTDVDVLEKLVQQGFKLPALVLEWRGLAKLKSTYIDGLLSSINQQTQRIHTSYSMAGTSTGRLSSSDPNLQNIPIRTENGRKIRQAFVAKAEHKLMSLDYSQIELRLLSHMATVPQLTKAFIDGLDIHTATASDIFNIPVDQVTSALRRQAKAINFGIIYGISAFGLSQQLDIPQTQAAIYIQSYFEKYPGIQEYMKLCKDFAKENGYVKTLFGRKCYVPGINDKNPMMRQFSERQAINAPLQGSNADIIKKAMNLIPSVLHKNRLDAQLLLQVHDELVFEVPENQLETTEKILKNTMQSITHLKVPLIVSVGIGNNWDEAH